MLQGVGVMIDDFFSTLGPHVVVALGSLLFMVWLQNFAFACVLSRGVHETFALGI